jgi:hypothetical protein
MGVVDHKVIASLLLAVFSSVLAMSIVLVFFIVQWRRRHLVLPLPDSDVKPASGTSPGPVVNERHLVLKRPECWLAIKSRNLAAVQSALSLHNSKPCTWAEGILEGGTQTLFIAPPVSGWILVIGSALPDTAEDVDVCFRFLMDLSRKIGQVQYFGANSVLNHHAWVQADSGHVTRAYAWAGKTLWNQGKMTPAELDLMMNCYDYGQNVEFQAFGQTAPVITNSEKVHLLAARWSLDPEEIDERFVGKEWGIVGEPSRHF